PKSTRVKGSSQEVVVAVGRRLVIERDESVRVDLDHEVALRLGIAEGRLSSGVAHGPVPAQALLEHPEQHRNLAIDVVADPPIPPRSTTRCRARRSRRCAKYSR